MSQFTTSERRSFYVALGFWFVGGLCWVPIFVYAAMHYAPGQPKDFGGVVLMGFTFLASAMFVVCGIVPVAYSLIHFVWRRGFAAR